MLARSLLYGTVVALLAAGYLVWLDQREKGRQDGLLTKISAVEMNMRMVPEGIRMLKEDVLAQNPNDDNRRRALLALAAVYDAQEKYPEAEETYKLVEKDWPSGAPRGALYVPWANQLVRAGRPQEALDMLERPGATEAESATEVEEIRLWARRKLAEKSAPGGAPPGPASAGTSTGGPLPPK